jgi:hypothetical protein
MPATEQPKDFRDAYPADAWKAVKLAIRQTVARAGGVEAVAAIFKSTKLNAGRVTEWQSANTEHLTAMPNLWQVGQIEAFAGVDWITQAMAALHGADVVKRGKADSVGVIMDRIASAAREMGEAISASATSAANPDCGKTREASIKEARESIRAMLELLAALEAKN